jgi:predicted acyltransferase
MLAFAVPVLLAGYLLNWWLMPINKILWTPSYVFFTAGLAMLLLGFLFFVIDVHGRRRWAWPAVVFGMNAIAAYVGSSIVPKFLNFIPIHKPGAAAEHQTIGLYSFLRESYTTGLRDASQWLAMHAHVRDVLAVPENMNLVNAVFLVFVLWFVLLVMYVCRVFVKV